MIQDSVLNRLLMELMPNEHVRLKQLLANGRCCLLCLGDVASPMCVRMHDNAVISATEVTAFALSTYETSIVGEHSDQNLHFIHQRGMFQDSNMAVGNTLPKKNTHLNLKSHCTSLKVYQ